MPEKPVRRDPARSDLIRMVVGHRVSEVATQQAVARCQTERDSPHSGSRRMHTARHQPSPLGGGFFIGESR